jgi:beta-lactamase regulating signal transducer with metallopeptidase domain
MGAVDTLHPSSDYGCHSKSAGGTSMAPMVERMAAAWMPMFVDAAIKGTVLLLLAGLAAALMRRSSAASRQTVWSLALAALLGLPILSQALPAWQVLPAWTAATEESGATLTPRLGDESVATPSGVVRSAPVRALGSPEADLTADATTHAGAVRGVPVRALGSPEADLTADTTNAGVVRSAPIGALDSPEADLTAAGQTGSRWRSLMPWGFIVWAVGGLVSVVPLVLGRVSLWRLARRSERVDDESWLGLARRAAAAVDLRRRVTIRQSGDEPMPMLWGILRPTLLLPAEADGWSAERWWVVLLHELAHAKRRDGLTKLIGHLACAVHWFNPLAWFAFTRLQRTSEAACDDLVLAAGQRPSDYATHLLELASGLQSGALATYASIAMARRSRLEGRLCAILDAGRNRRRLTRCGLLVASALAAGVSVPLSILGGTAGEDGANAQSAARMPVREDADRVVNLGVFEWIWKRFTIGLCDPDDVEPGLYVIGRYSRSSSWSLPSVYEGAATGKTPAGYFELIGRLPGLHPADLRTELLHFEKRGNTLEVEFAYVPKRGEGQTAIRSRTKSAYLRGSLPVLPPGRYHVRLTGREHQEKNGQLVPVPKDEARVVHELRCDFEVSAPVGGTVGRPDGRSPDLRGKYAGDHLARLLEELPQVMAADWYCDVPAEAWLAPNYEQYGGGTLINLNPRYSSRNDGPAGASEGGRLWILCRSYPGTAFDLRQRAPGETPTELGLWNGHRVFVAMHQRGGWPTWEADIQRALQATLAPPMSRPAVSSAEQRERGMEILRTFRFDLIDSLPVGETLPPLSVVLEALRNPDESIRASALGVLFLDPDCREAPESLPVLQACLKDVSSLVRQYALQILGGLGPRACRAWPTVDGALKDKEAAVRTCAVLALMAMDPPRGRSAALALLNDPAAEVRIGAAAILAHRCGTHAEDGPFMQNEALPVFRAALDREKDEGVRREMSRALSSIAFLLAGNIESAPPPFRAGRWTVSDAADDLPPFRAYVPSRWVAAKTWPMTVVFSPNPTGRSMPPREVAEWTAWAERWGWIVLLPEPIVFPVLPGDTGATSGEDLPVIVASCQRLVTRAVETCRVDPQRVFVVGQRRSGELALDLAMDLPERSAGLALLSCQLRMDFIDEKRLAAARRTKVLILSPDAEIQTAGTVAAWLRRSGMSSVELRSYPGEPEFRLKDFDEFARSQPTGIATRPTTQARSVPVPAPWRATVGEVEAQARVAALRKERKETGQFGALWIQAQSAAHTVRHWNFGPALPRSYPDWYAVSSEDTERIIDALAKTSFFRRARSVDMGWPQYAGPSISLRLTTAIGFYEENLGWGVGPIEAVARLRSAIADGSEGAKAYDAMLATLRREYEVQPIDAVPPYISYGDGPWTWLPKTLNECTAGKWEMGAFARGAVQPPGWTAGEGMTATLRSTSSGPVATLAIMSEAYAQAPFAPVAPVLRTNAEELHPWRGRRVFVWGAVSDDLRFGLRTALYSTSGGFWPGSIRYATYGQTMKGMRLTLSADRTTTSMRPEGDNAQPVSLTLTFINDSDQPQRLNVTQMATEVQWQLAGPDVESVWVLDHALQVEQRPPVEADFVTVPAGGQWRYEVREFPGYCGGYTYQFRRPGQYRVSVYYVRSVSNQVTLDVR